MALRNRFLIVLASVLSSEAAFAEGKGPYRWLDAPVAVPDTLEARVPPPPGFSRRPEKPGSFAHWLRGLPVKPGRPPVLLFNGTPKRNQEAHHLVLDIDVGKRDRQQCADAVMRLRAEFLHQAAAEDDICFEFTDRTPARWLQWKSGLRPQVGRHKTTWSKTAAPDVSYASFRRYLEVVFSYAGTVSLARELDEVPDARLIEGGDIFIEGGFPGHAVIVVDVVEDSQGQRAVLLAQSYMPAQEIHVLRNPATPGNPWYLIKGNGPLVTPEWDFPAGSLRRFNARVCPRAR